MKERKNCRGKNGMLYQFLLKESYAYSVCENYRSSFGQDESIKGLNRINVEWICPDPKPFSSDIQNIT